MSNWLKLTVNRNSNNDHLELCWEVYGSTDDPYKFERVIGYAGNHHVQDLVVEVTSWPSDTQSGQYNNMTTYFRPWQVNGSNAMPMAKTLKHIDTFLEREYQREGSADAGAFVMRVCRALKCEGVVEMTSYGPEFYRQGKIRDRVNSLIYLYHYERNKA